MYFAADGSFLGQSIKGGSQIRIVTDYSVFKQKDKLGNVKTMYKIEASKVIDQFDVKAAGKVYQTIYNREIKGNSKVSAEPNERKFHVAGHADSDTGEIKINTKQLHVIKTEKGYERENVNNDYNNVTNVMFHEENHIQGISDSGFEHFEIWKSQITHSSFNKGTPIFKDYIKQVGLGYISDMEVNIKQLIRNRMNYPEATRKEQLKIYYNDYLKNVKTYNTLTKSNVKTKSQADIENNVIETTTKIE